MFWTNKQLREDNKKLKRECDYLKFDKAILKNYNVNKISRIVELETKIELLEKELREVKVRNGGRIYLNKCHKCGGEKEDKEKGLCNRCDKELEDQYGKGD